MIRRVTAADILTLRWTVLHAGEPRSAARLRGDLAPTTSHWALFEAAEPVAALSVHHLRGYALRAMVVRPDRQRRGVGRLLLLHAQAELGVPLWCNAREAAVPFYLAVGWRAEGPVFPLDGAPHQRMTWTPP